MFEINDALFLYGVKAIWIVVRLLALYFLIPYAIKFVDRMTRYDTDAEIEKDNLAAAIYSGALNASVIAALIYTVFGI